MTTYFEHNERTTRKDPPKTAHNVEIIDLPDIMVTEHPPQRHDWHCPCVFCRIDRGEDQ